MITNFKIQELSKTAINEIIDYYKELGETRKENINCYCYEIFQERDLIDRNTPQYTWQWNLTENEYKGIKELLKKHSGVLKKVINKNKICCKLLQMFISEWYKREYNGNDRQGNAFDSIEIDDIQELVCRKLGIDEKNVYRDSSKRARWIDTIYVDGGLPLNYILNRDKTLFRTTIKGIIESNIEGTVYCSDELDNLCNNQIVNQSYNARLLLPNGKDASIYDFIQETIINENLKIDGFENFVEKIRDVKKIVDKEQRRKTPFVFKWLFNFNDPDTKIDIYYDVIGPTTLSDDFLQAHQISDAQYITISVKCNNNTIYIAEYDERHYCRRNVKYKGKYKVGDEITVEIEESGEVLLTHDLDFSDPKLLSTIDSYNNTYTLCDSKKLAISDCRVIALDNWVSETLNNKVYIIDNEPYKVFFLRQTTEPIIINSEIESKTFDPKKNFCWTIIDPRCVLRTQISTKEPLYDAAEMQFFKGEENRVDRNNQRVKFATKGSREWNDQPKLGEIRARIDMGNESVDTVRFINVGKLSISKIESNRDTCDVRINWDGGDVASTEAVFQNGIWHISKNQLNNIRFVPFDFTPDSGKGDAFRIHICPLFDDFKILDPELKEVPKNSVIPMVDLQTYSYYLHGNDINLRFGGDQEEQVQYRNAIDQNKLNVKRRRDTDGHEELLHSVPCEGFLSAFFGGTNTIRNLLERSVQPITESIDKVDLYKNKNRVPEVYYFKDFPYRIIQSEENCLSISNCVTFKIKDVDQSLALPPYKGELLSIPVNVPTATPIKLFREQLTEDKSNPVSFIIPDEIQESPNKQWLVYGDLQGLILPKLIDFGKSLNDEERSRLKRNNIQRIKKELNDAKLFDDKWETAIRWLELIPEGRIPASSMLTMVAIADDPILLEKLALHLYIKHFDSLEDVSQELNEFQRQMQFLWSWVPTENLTEFISFDTPYLKHYYDDWLTERSVSDFVSSDKQTLKMLYECRKSLIQGFNQWFYLLKYDNEPIQNPHPLYTDPKLNAFGVGLQSEEARNFFKEIPTPGNPTPKERWLLERRLAHKAIIDGERNAWELGYSPKVTKEIHRSIIYGLKFEYKEQ